MAQAVGKVKAVKLTFFGNQGSATEEQQINGGLSTLDMTANLVDVLEKTGIIFDKVIFASRVKMSELCLDPFALAFSASEEVDARLLCLFGKLFERGLPDATRCTNKDCNEPSRETGGDVGIGSTHQLEGDHGGRLWISRCSHDVQLWRVWEPWSDQMRIQLIRERKQAKN